MVDNINDNYDEFNEDDHDKIELRDISTEMKESFLDYSMSVIVSRALPDVRDGMKPVHRRILYAMNNLGMYSDRPFRKSAMLVGEVMGNYHPHGDSAIYSSIVRMAQDFSFRYPLIQGQGNFGSIDGDGAAAMRYTESRMSKISMEMMRDINKDTVDYMDNYDASQKEPTVLPSRIPQLILNGSMGIAVGMATNIPPHNLSETVDALIAIIKNPEISTLELMNDYIFGPDFPTGGYILGRTGIKKAFMTGRGSVLMRAKTHIEALPNDRQQIVVTEIPYQVNKARMVERIAALVREKVIEGITDLRDESNRNGIRVVIEVRRDVNAEVLLNQLFRMTQLQASFGVNNIALVNGQPKLLGIKELFTHYLNHQVEVVTRKTQYELDRAKERAHILEGLLIALDNIDEVIHIIRDSMSDEEASNRLAERFGLSPEQCKSILDMRLRRLTGLERNKIQEEFDQLVLTIEDLMDILANEHRIYEIIETDFLEMKDKYGDARRSEIIEEGYDLEDEDLIEREDVVISMTMNGYIKRTSLDTYSIQHRGGRGVRSMSMHDDDVIDLLVTMNTHEHLLFFTNYGKVYRLKAYQVPPASRTSMGIPVINILQLEKDEKIKSLVRIPDYAEAQYVVFVTKNGYIKKTAVEHFDRIQRNGKIAISLDDHDELVSVKATDGQNEILIATSRGKAIRFEESRVRPMGRSARGVRGIDVDGGEVVGMATNVEGSKILVVTEKGYGKITPIDDYRLTSRGGKGVITIRITDRNGPLVAFRSVEGDEEALLVTSIGTLIRISLNGVGEMGRNTQGVKLINVKDAIVSNVAIVDSTDEEEINSKVEESE